MICSNDVGFAHYFEENMQAIGLPAPNSGYTTIVAVVGALKGMSDAIATYGRTATPAQLALRITWGYSVAPIVARAAGFILAVGAAYYVGAMIGSAAVAAYKAAGCSGPISVAQVVSWARSQDIDSQWLEAELISNPEILARLA